MNAIQSTPGYLSRVFDDPRLQRLHTPRSRQVASVAQALASVLLALALQVAIPMVPHGIAGLGVLVLVPAVLIWVITTGRLNASVHGITEIPDVDLDEFQRAMRDSAHRKAWRVATWFAVGVYVLWSIPADLMPDVITPQLILGALLILVGLPVHILAWTFPPETGAEAEHAD